MAPTERPDIGYAMIFPSATIVKVIAVQIIGLLALGPLPTLGAFGHVTAGLWDQRSADQSPQLGSEPKEQKSWSVMEGALGLHCY